MKFKGLAHYFLLILLFWGNSVFAQDMLELYKKAESFMPSNTEKLIYGLQVIPHWFPDSSGFWYKCNTRKGKEFISVNVSKRIKKQAFNQEKLAKSLSRFLGKVYKPYELPFDSIEISKDKRAVRFIVGLAEIECSLKTYTCTKIKGKKYNPSVVVSPDGKWEAFVKNFNLYIRKRKSKKEIPLTCDGQSKYGYGTSWNYGHLMNESHPKKTKPVKTIYVKWSPDSTRFVSHRVDYRDAKKLYLIQSSVPVDHRAQVWSYYRTLPGEQEGVKFEYFIFDIIKSSQVAIDTNPLHSIVTMADHKWFSDSSRLFYYYFARGYRSINIAEISAITGKTRNVLKYPHPIAPYKEEFTVRLFNNEKELIWGSDRDNWNHLYIYNWQTGSLKNRVTSGEYVVRNLLAADEKTQLLYFLASSREPDQDPYFQQLYSIKTDGTGLNLLTPEKAEHQVSLSPDKKYFVNSYSRIDMPPLTVLRRLSDGKVLLELEKADISDLLATGWTFPQAFKVKARDNKTDIYGVMIRPIDFDPAKKYPVIDSSYSMAVLAPKSFEYGCLSSSQAMAQLGFIMVVVDGLGTPHRSRKISEFAYKNLGGLGAPDHVTALIQLAERHPYLDLDRVGIRGHSVGGFDTARALLTYPEFYKVGVSSAGNHDHQMNNAWFTELYMGYPVGHHYWEQSNTSLVKNLQGKLLLIHPEMDSNVNPSLTMRLAAELVRANKDFDLVILPDAGHGAVANQYFMRKTWDYFVRHLLGKEPPHNYFIKTLAGAEELPQ